MAGFLVLTGLTGAIISWDHELDEWLNPHLHEARTTGRLLDPMDLVAGIEARHPEVQVTMLPLRASLRFASAASIYSRITGTCHNAFPIINDRNVTDEPRSDGISTSNSGHPKIT